VKTVEIDSLRFNDRDLEVVGTLEYGQFGVVELKFSPDSFNQLTRYRSTL